MTATDRLADGNAFGANRQPITGVLDVDARVNPPVGGQAIAAGSQQRGSDAKPGVGDMSVAARCPGRGDQAAKGGWREIHSVLINSVSNLVRFS